MIKDIIRTIVMDEERMKKILTEKKSVFLLIFLFTNVIFTVIFNCFLFFTEQDFSFYEYFLLSFIEIKNNCVFCLLWILILFLIFCNKLEKKQCVDLVLKTIISMKFIYPIYTVIFHYFENGIILLGIILYDMIFVIKFLKVNIQEDVSTIAKIRLYVILSFFILLMVYGGIYKLLLLQ